VVSVDEHAGAADDDAFAGGEATADGDGVAEHFSELDPPEPRDLRALRLLHDDHGELPGGIGAHDGGQRHGELRIGRCRRSARRAAQNHCADHSGAQPAVSIGDGHLDIEDAALCFGSRGDRGDVAGERRAVRGLDDDVDSVAEAHGVNHAVGDPEARLHRADLGEYERGGADRGQ
jgi:hypothetical protein